MTRKIRQPDAAPPTPAREGSDLSGELFNRTYRATGEPPATGVAAIPLDAHTVLRKRKIGVRLAVIIAFLVAADLATQYSKYHLGHGRLFGIIELLDLDGEGNLPVFYQTAVLLAGAAAAAGIAAAARQSRDPYTRHWRGLAWIIFYLAMDEASGIHELLGDPLQAALKAGGWLHYTWVLAGLAFALVVALAYLRFLIALPPRARWGLVLAGALYVSGAAGVEMIGGRFAARWGETNFPYQLLTALEETLEMAGAAILLLTLLGHAQRRDIRTVLAVQ